MQHQGVRAKRQRALDLAAKRSDTLLAHIVRLAAHVHQVAGMNHNRPYIKLGAQFAHTRSLFGIDLRRAPHPRARREELKGIGANLTRAF